MPEWDCGSSSTNDVDICRKSRFQLVLSMTALTVISVMISAICICAVKC